MFKLISQVDNNELKELMYESIRYLIECYLRTENKQNAIDLYNSELKSNDYPSETFKLVKEMGDILIKFYSNDLVGALDTYNLDYYFSNFKNSNEKNS